MVIFQRTHGFQGWEARVAYGDSSFGQVEPVGDGWQVRLFRGLTDLTPIPVGSLAQGQRFIKRFGEPRARQLAFARDRDLRMRAQMFFVPAPAGLVTRYKKGRAKSLPT